MMPPKEEKQFLPLGEFSNLPENIIDVILMCLPFKDAVRTSILSKKWRYKWYRLSELTLDKTVWTTKKDSIFCTSEITKIISHILIRHEGPITKFTLHIPSSRKCLEIDDFIYFLSRNGIQHLDLRLGDNSCKLHSSFFTCLELRHLNLEKCLIIPPPAFKGFDRLISLELRDVTISSKLLESLICHCLLLEKLVLKVSGHLSEDIEISATMLRSFAYTGNIRFVCLNNVPRLVKLSLNDGGYHHWGGRCNIANFFEPLSALEHLYLDNDTVKLLAEVGGVELKRLPFDLNRVKRLYLSDRLCLGELDITLCALCLIRSFPCLEYMEIEVEDDDDDNIPALECLEVEAFSDVTFNHLREVKITKTLGSKAVMQLIKLLLAKSPVLTKMLIMPLGLHQEFETIKILVELTKFQRASPKAEVVYAYSV